MKFLIINGPNINMLGIREPEIYGTESYRVLLDRIDSVCRELGIEYEEFQSNHEGDIVDKIQEAYGKADGIVINPAAYTHTSIAIPDALKAVGIPTAEVHLTDIRAREPYRAVSYVAQTALFSICGHGIEGYAEAIRRLRDAVLLNGTLNASN